MSGRNCAEADESRPPGGPAADAVERDGPRTDRVMIEVECAPGAATIVVRGEKDLQVRHQEGPCIAAFEDKELVRAEDLSQDDRWPSFSQHAVARGVRAVLASPIPYNQDAVGVVAVLSEDRRPWSAEAELGLLTFTDLAALLIASMLLGEQQTELAAQLQSALNSRAIIEQAKGVLIGRQGLTAHAAYAQLGAQARAERRKLAIVSAEVVRNAIRVNRAAVREN